MSLNTSQCVTCIFNQGGVCLARKPAYPITFVCNDYLTGNKVVTKEKGDDMARKKQPPPTPKKPVQTEWKLVSTKDKSHLMYYAYLPEEK
jgi:hypothetical protein